MTTVADAKNSRSRSRAARSGQRRRGQGRARVVASAYRLFLEQGYEATTMQEVADDAGVAVQTVYYLFGTKAALLAAAESHAVLGDRPATSFRDAPWAEALSGESDPDELIRQFVAADTEIKGRLAGFVVAVGSAISSSPADQNRRDSGRDGFFGFLVDRLSALGALRRDLSTERAVDMVRVLDSLDSYIELTRRRGWTDDEWRDWLTDLLVRVLTQPP